MSYSPCTLYVRDMFHDSRAPKQTTRILTLGLTGCRSFNIQAQIKTAAYGTLTSHRLSSSVLTPDRVTVLGYFPEIPCIQILYIFSCRLQFTSKRSYGASKTILNNG